MKKTKQSGSWEENFDGTFHRFGECNKRYCYHIYDDIGTPVGLKDVKDFISATLEQQLEEIYGRIVAVFTDPKTIKEMEEFGKFDLKAKLSQLKDK